MGVVASDEGEISHVALGLQAENKDGQSSWELFLYINSKNIMNSLFFTCSRHFNTAGIADSGDILKGYKTQGNVIDSFAYFCLALLVLLAIISKCTKK